MSPISFPSIDLKATGANINALRRAKGYSVRDLQEYFGFAQPQAIYKWQWGETLPSVDNLYALSILLDTPMNDILISTDDGADFFMRKYFSTASLMTNTIDLAIINASLKFQGGMIL